MNSPCKECIVRSMCSDDCLLLKEFVFREVTKYNIPISLMKSLTQNRFFKNNTITLGWEGHTKGLIIKDGEVSKHTHKEKLRSVLASTSFSWTRGD